MTEFRTRFVNRIADQAKLEGWRIHVSPTNVEGFPELIIMRDEEVLGLKIQDQSGDISPEAMEWVEMLNNCGVKTEVWAYEDWSLLLDLLAHGVVQSPLVTSLPEFKQGRGNEPHRPYHKRSFRHTYVGRWRADD